VLPHALEALQRRPVLPRRAARPAAWPLAGRRRRILGDEAATLSDLG